MRKLILCFALLAPALLPAQETPSWRGDFESFWTTIRDNYAYFDKKQTDWDRVHTLYAPQADTVRSRSGLIDLLERAFYELYDHHASLHTNLPGSQLLVPSGADLWAVFRNGRATITDVRPGTRAADGGLHAGMIVIRANGLPVADAIGPFMPRALKANDSAANDFALRTLLAGNHRDFRDLVLLDGRDTIRYRDKTLPAREAEKLLETAVYPGNIGYIRIGNSLGDNDLVPAFDSVLKTMADTKGLILDLRAVPSGGNTTVVRAIMGCFIRKEGFYQKHVLPSEEKETGIRRSWVEIVSPRTPAYNRPLAVLCGHWTGSVGEGLVIGFDALKQGLIIGTDMAGLRGAVYSFTLPYSGIGYSFPAEQLYHVDGRPRENFHPAVIIDPAKGKGDTALAFALNYLQRQRR